MPEYEYRCLDCKKRHSRLLLSFSAASKYTPKCPFCQSMNVRRLVSRVNTISGTKSSGADSADDASFEGVDENDPKSMGRWMRRMSEETGEDLGPEFNDVVGRLEAGQDPEQIEKDLPIPPAEDSGDNSVGMEE